jgi:hypothetical protein
MAAKANRNLVILDTETWGLDTRRCELVELGAVVLDGDTLEFVKGAEFQTFIRPLDWTNFSEGAVNVTGITPQMLRDEKDSLTGQKIKVMDRSAAFQAFDAFCKEYRIKGAGFGGCPHAAGKNIRAFDLPLLDRIARDEKMASKDGLNRFFDRKIVVDLEELLFYWFTGRDEKPADFTMDGLCDYLGYKRPGKHRALIDAKQEGAIIRRFLKLFRSHAPRVKFENTMVDEVMV